jgi:hypothetical protein
MMKGGRVSKRLPAVVMPGLDPGIHSATPDQTVTVTEWIAGSSPAMTTNGWGVSARTGD